MEMVKVRGLSWVSIAGMANHHGTKKAMVISASWAEVKPRDTLAEAMALCRD
jgi:hypothetical protein